MTSIIDQAARALARQQCGTNDWDGLDPELQERLRDQVRAALGAMSEASETMVAAGRQVAFGAIDAQDAENIWRAMLDAALAETDGIAQNPAPTAT